MVSAFNLQVEECKITDAFLYRHAVIGEDNKLHVKIEIDPEDKPWIIFSICLDKWTGPESSLSEHILVATDSHNRWVVLDQEQHVLRRLIDREYVPLAVDREIIDLRAIKKLESAAKRAYVDYVEDKEE